MPKLKSRLDMWEDKPLASRLIRGRKYEGCIAELEIEHDGGFIKIYLRPRKLKQLLRWITAAAKDSE